MVYLLHPVDTHRIKIEHLALVIPYDTNTQTFTKGFVNKREDCRTGEKDWGPLSYQVENHMEILTLKIYSALPGQGWFTGSTASMFCVCVCVDGMRCIRRCYALNTEI